MLISLCLSGIRRKSPATNDSVNSRSTVSLFRLRGRSLKSRALLHLIYRVPPFPIVDYDNSPDNGRNIQLPDTVFPLTLYEYASIANVDIAWKIPFGKRYLRKKLQSFDSYSDNPLFMINSTWRGILIFVIKFTE